MKHIETTDGINWKQINNISLTKEQIDILKDAESEAASALRAELNTNRYTVLSAEESVVAKAKYDELKPEVKETEQYQLIAVNMMLDGDATSGIINYRVNGDHKQIRF
jgi:Spy/CpxP family protein refolding chaperone